MRRPSALLWAREEDGWHGNSSPRLRCGAQPAQLGGSGSCVATGPEVRAGSRPGPRLHLDGAAFTFAATSGTAVTLLLGLAPALFARRTDLNLLIKTGGNQTTRVANGGWGTALAIAQVSLSVVLLLGTALLLRSFLHLVTVNPGFETAHVLRYGIGLPEKRYDTDQKLIDFHHELLQRPGGIPGVLGAGAAGRFPLTGAAGGSTFPDRRGRHSGSPAPAGPDQRRHAGLFRGTVDSAARRPRFLMAGRPVELPICRDREPGVRPNVSARQTAAGNADRGSTD